MSFFGIGRSVSNGAHYEWLQGNGMAANTRYGGIQVGTKPNVKH